MSAKLLSHTSIGLVARAARMCTGNEDVENVSGQVLSLKDKKLISKRILKQGEPFDPLNPSHESVLEHAVYTFELEFSRACLQELARHRIASPSVQSTRWALKKLLKDIDTEVLSLETERTLKKLLVRTGDEGIDKGNILQLYNVARRISDNVPNDKAKFGLPEAFRTKLMFTINARSLRNWFALRTSKRALWEIRETAYAMFDALPESHKFMFEDRVHPRKENKND